ncbi:hypothetical protein BSG18_30170 [Pseudomonas ogarae]|uniref:hypothetical protein n=1 Tax=Pseudomonas ogarae (strain DSM 112162 / CECT 30235 / F113) TaxID=1114970 RepID=UPI0011432579|nr:hypothetical protein [Pseudomonas ogarae]PBJ21587.1 hypothetical protein BSG18_30170 [Pseudomonas ogarae]
MVFDVLPYSIESLIGCFVSGSQDATLDSVSNKRHRIYFEEYFAVLGAETIVVEHHYIDRDYLEDYAAYYDRCFRDYPRRTKRLHFFSVSFDGDALEARLVNTVGSISEEVLQEGYLGFVVVKPLPQTIIGRTCLKTYPSDEGRRHFPSLRLYPVNLFGLELKIHSLAYQEQDSVVAACATSALWTCFQGTGKLFQHIIPPPVEITKWAGDLMPENLTAASSRAFPNSGLTATQMAHAVKRIGLEPYVVGTTSRYSLNGVVYAYLRGKIPSILACQLIEQKEGRWVSKGGHAIAVTGFSIGVTAPADGTASGFKLRANRIDKIYGHDDQIGPFARMAWNSLPQIVGQTCPRGDVLDTSWGERVFAAPDFILMPLYHKIRIPYVLVHDAILQLDAIMENVRTQAIPTLNRPEWDIYLITSSDYKSSIRSEYLQLDVDIKSSLFVDLPRFLWRVTLRDGDNLHLDFLFDATGIAQHNLLVHVVSTDSGYAQILGIISTLDPAMYGGLPLQAESVLEKFRLSPLPPLAVA